VINIAVFTECKAPNNVQLMTV